MTRFFAADCSRLIARALAIAVMVGQIAIWSMPVRAQEAPSSAPAAAAAAVPATVPAADPATVAAAIALMEAIGSSNNFDRMISMLRTHVTAGSTDATTAKSVTDKFDSMLAKFDTYKQKMLEETAALYAAKFTVAELKSVTEFYKSGAGAKFIAEMPELMDQAGGIGQKYAVQMMKDLKESKDAP